MKCREILEALRSGSSLRLCATLDLAGDCEGMGGEAGGPVVTPGDLEEACRLAGLLSNLAGPEPLDLDKLLADIDVANALEKLARDPVLEALTACLLRDGGVMRDACG